jgi:hypothetical protein
MARSIINQNSYGLIINLTSHFNHVGLIVFLSTVEGFINPWNAPPHVFHYIIFLKVMPIHHPISFMGTIYIHVVSFTSPILYGLLSWPFTQGISHIGLILCSLPLPICLRIIPEERCLESFLPLIHISFLFVIPNSLKSFPFPNNSTHTNTYLFLWFHPRF